MKALVCKKLGKPVLMQEGDGSLILDLGFQNPYELKEDWVHIKVFAASVNFADALTIMGKYQERPPLPFIPGAEVSGIIISVGEKVTDFSIGDRVCAVVGTGGFAEEVSCPSNVVFHVPDGCDMAAAAGLPIAFGTSHLGLIHRAGLQSGEVLLVLGAGGGVGLAATQIGKLVGAHVIAVCRGEEKAKVLLSLGADLVIDTGKKVSVRVEVSNYLKSKGIKGVNVLFDPVGGALFKESMKTLSWGSRIIIIGFASGEIPNIPANVALVKNLTIHGLYWGSYLQYQPIVLKKSMEYLLFWLKKGALKVHISHQFFLEQANEAFLTLLSRKVIGKIIFKMDQNSRL